MSSAKAALESDTRVLAFEAGRYLASHYCNKIPESTIFTHNRKYGIRVNTISAGNANRFRGVIFTYRSL